MDAEMWSILILIGTNFCLTLVILELQRRLRNVGH